MKPGFFPALLPDELLFSAVARFAVFSQLTAEATNLELFGNRLVYFRHDVPNHVVLLAKRIPSSTATDLLHQHTLLPFFIALMTPDAREKVRERVLRDEQVMIHLVGPFARVPKATHLRFCPECDDFNRELYGVAFWQRRHQLPTSLVCVQHRRPLLASAAETIIGRKRRYEIAGQWGPDRPPLVPELTGARLERLILLANAGYAFLDWDEASGPSDQRLSLREEALAAGFAIEGPRVTKIDQRDLSETFETRDSEVVRLWPWLNETNQFGTLEWVLRHTNQKSRVSRTTFTHSILSTFLAACRRWPVLPPAPPDTAWNAVHVEPRLIDFGIQSRERSDDQLLADAQLIVRLIKSHAPPVRVSLMELYRASPTLARAMRSPENLGVRGRIVDMMEDVPAFQLRRVAWIIRCAQAGGEELTITQMRWRSGIPDFKLLRQLIAQARALIASGHDPTEEVSGPI